MEGDSEKESYYELDDIFGPESIDNYDRLIQMQCNPDLIKKAMKHLQSDEDLDNNAREDLRQHLEYAWVQSMKDD